MVNTHFIKRTLHYAMIRNNKTFLKIGNVRAPINEITKNPELVPIGHGNTNLPISIIKSLKWMLKKNLLNQDMFLMGLPGFLRLQITFQFLELCNYEFEYLPITHDTTEADIKQRREIKNNNVFYSDLCAVKAALNGRVLIIDGVEKAERNVLPIINNLLENREMQLDDGRFLMAADKYDKLLKTYSIEQLKQWRLERVSTKFQVIALGLPYPTFQSNPLDPPLRSRFQCFNFTTLPFETMLYYSKILAPNVDEKKMENLLSVVYGLMSQNQKLAHFFSKNNVILNTNKLQSTELNNLPLFPVENILKAVQIWNKNPSYSVYYVFSLCYPYKTILKTELQQPILMEFMRKFNVELNELSNFYISKLNIKKNNEQTIAEVNLSHNNTIVVNAGTCIKNTQKFVKIDEFEMLLANMMVTHSESDFCILGARGSGKTTIVKEFANRLGYEIETIMLYQDMNSREMLQQRRILPNGDTIWEDSQLVKAAKNGLLCVLDGLERVHSSLLELIQTLIYQRFLQLPDGSRLLGASQFDLLQQKTKLSAKLLNKKKIFKIAPNFRIIGLGNIESANSSNKWLNEQILSIFLFHTLNPLSFQNEMKIITELIPNVCQQSAEKLLSLAHNLCKSHDQALRGIGNSLSLRKILALLRKNSYDSSEGLYETIQRSVLSRFLPVLVRETFEAKIQEVGIVSLTLKNQENKQSDKLINFKKENLNTNKFYNQVMIPDIVFYDNEQHFSIMEKMAKDFELGFHILLIGNQGVGKNKIIDRFLQLMERPKQYIQLHRDTTVQSLTVQATIVENVLKYEDSPLIKAVKDGFVLVIDEADKAPLHVIAVLKSLLESGVLHLSDGRIILPANENSINLDKNIIYTHKNFRIVMLANRPGFPFLGNDLFGILGDLLSVHVVENPDPKSEFAMLKKYGPDVSNELIKKLINAFNDLRKMADQNLLTYPYSTRELVHIIRHLQKFPNDSINKVLKNTFDFDSYSLDVIETVQKIFNERGFSINKEEWNGYSLDKSLENKQERIEYERDLSELDLSKLDTPKLGKIDPKNTPHVGGNTWAGGTGGYNTAGLGGVGGPFRLDAGHNVHQLPDKAKAQIPNDVLLKAREVAKNEYAKKLQEIEMSDYDANAYNELYEKISKNVKIFRSIIDSLEAKKHERQWAKNQTSGDLDDSKLIEGIVGEKNVYRRRVDQKPELGFDQAKPKKIRFCFDVSGSMYRFNGLDNRLQRSLEVALLVMEAFEQKNQKIKYDIYGHSGESFEIEFVKDDDGPKNEKQKINVLKKMLAHSQYCWSGDNTLEAIYKATADLKKEKDVDERFLVVFSDANFNRYGISPNHLQKALNLDESVNTFLILIGSLGLEAEKLQNALPKEKAFVAKNTSKILPIMQKIFSSTLFK